MGIAAYPVFMGSAGFMSSAVCSMYHVPNLGEPELGVMLWDEASALYKAPHFLKLPCSALLFGPKP